jgi:hypothetical protein
MSASPTERFDLPPQSLLQTLQNCSAVLNSEILASQSAPCEEVMVRYTRGTGRFSADRRFITLKMYMYKMNGELDGFHEGVWEAAFSSPFDLLKRPDPPPGPLDVPQGPVPDISPMAYTKAIWAFGDGSSIYAIGPALSHLMPMEDNSSLFTVTCAQVVTGGDGKYQGARGLKTSLGSTWSDQNIFTAQGDVRFQATTIDTFRIIRAEHIR